MKDKEIRGWCKPDSSNKILKITPESQIESKEASRI